MIYRNVNRNHVKKGATLSAFVDLLRWICYLFVEYRYILYGILGGVFLGVQLTAVKLIKSINSFHILFYRSLAYLPCLAFINLDQIRSFNTSDWIISISSGSVNAVALVLAYIAVSFAHVGNVSCIVANQPIPGAIMSFIFLREKLHVLDIGIILLNVTGIVLVSKPPIIFGNDAMDTDYQREFVGALFATASVTSFAFSTMTAKILTNRGTADVAFLLFLSGFTGGTAFVIEMFTSGNLFMLPSSAEWPFVACVALCSVFGAACIIWALEGISFLVMAMLFTLCTPVAFALGCSFLNEEIELISTIGAFLTIGSTLWYLLSKETSDESGEGE